MPPRHHTLPRAQTESAREAQKSFYCELCSKGYTRMNDYESHLSSYDHTHKQRLRDMKQMVKDPNAIARARKQEQKAEGLVSISLATSSAASNGGGGGGFKKGGFKKTGFKSAFVPVPATAQAGDTTTDDNNAGEPVSKKLKQSGLVSVESDTEDEGYEMYDPRHPTD